MVGAKAAIIRAAFVYRGLGLDFYGIFWPAPRPKIRLAAPDDRRKRPMLWAIFLQENFFPSLPYFGWQNLKADWADAVGYFQKLRIHWLRIHWTSRERGGD
jgi:hypothetical protein